MFSLTSQIKETNYLLYRKKFIVKSSKKYSVHYILDLYHVIYFM